MLGGVVRELLCKETLRPGKTGESEFWGLLGSRKKEDRRRVVPLLIEKRKINRDRVCDPNGKRGKRLKTGRAGFYLSRKKQS